MARQPKFDVRQIISSNGLHQKQTSSINSAETDASCLPRRGPAKVNPEQTYRYFWNRNTHAIFFPRSLWSLRMSVPPTPLEGWKLFRPTSKKHSWSKAGRILQQPGTPSLIPTSHVQGRFPASCRMIDWIRLGKAGSGWMDKDRGRKGDTSLQLAAMQITAWVTSLGTAET